MRPVIRHKIPPILRFYYLIALVPLLVMFGEAQRESSVVRVELANISRLECHKYGLDDLLEVKAIVEEYEVSNGKRRRRAGDGGRKWGMR